MWGLQFDADEDITLKSVKVWNGTSSEGSYTGDRTFTVFNSSGATIATATVNIKDGEQRLELNMQIPKGTDYRLISDKHKGMWRDTKGASFPYSIGGVVNIKNGVRYDGVMPDDLTAYYFFYDWEVATGGATCTSERVKVDLVTELGENKENSISIYPNPATNYVYINNLPNSNCNVILYNSSMQQVKSLKSNGSSDLRINFNKLSSGIYFCRVASENNILTMKKIVIVK
jgi:hypothetical protein